MKPTTRYLTIPLVMGAYVLSSCAPAHKIQPIQPLESVEAHYIGDYDKDSHIDYVNLTKNHQNGFFLDVNLDSIGEVRLPCKQTDDFICDTIQTPIEIAPGIFLHFSVRNKNSLETTIRDFSKLSN